MNPNRNPSEERLLAYAAGSLSPPEAVVIAAHLALRPANDAWVRRLQAVGGEFLEEAAPVALSADALAHAMALIETDAGEAKPPAPLNDMPELPESLRRYALGPWRWIGPGIHARDVHAPRDGACRVILLKIDPGRETPRHTHGGVELTCVLSCAYAT
ncbi:MAG: ChrR family anti-sigma-E factor, partial [Brevundimonas sp.]